MLSEARKYALGLVLANQFVSQLEESVKDAVFGNIGTLMSYRVGVPDASVLQHEFTPVFNETDLANVGAQNIYVKTVIQGSPVPPFSMDVYKDIKAERAQGSKKGGGDDQRIVPPEIRARPGRGGSRNRATGQTLV